MLIPGLSPVLSEARQTPKHGAQCCRSCACSHNLSIEGELYLQGSCSQMHWGPDSFLPALVRDNVPLNPPGFCYHGL